MSSQATGLLPGQSPPLTVITSTDHSGFVLIATTLGLVFTLVSLLIRVYVRYECSDSFARDDVVVTVAGILSIFQSSVVFVEVKKGFGKLLTDVDPAELVQMQKASYASDILYIVTLWLTKCSIAFLFLRLSPNARGVLASKAILILTTLLMVASIFIVALRCDLAHAWIFINARCAGLYTRWQIFAAFDIATEAALSALSIYVIYALQMSMRKKFIVAVAFGLRLPVVVPAAFRLYYLHREFSSSDPTFDGVLATICTQVDMSYAIISATIPCLRPFMIATNTQPSKHSTSKGSSRYATGTNQEMRSNNFTLSCWSSKLNASNGAGKEVMAPTGMISGWEGFNHAAYIISPGDHHSMESQESKQMIIRKDVEWAVNYEEQVRDQGYKWEVSG